MQFLNLSHFSFRDLLLFAWLAVSSFYLYLILGDTPARAGLGIIPTLLSAALFRYYDERPFSSKLRILKIFEFFFRWLLCAAPIVLRHAVFDWYAPYSVVRTLLQRQ